MTWVQGGRQVGEQPLVEHPPGRHVCVIMSNRAGVSADGYDGYDGFDAAHHDGLTWLDVAIADGPAS